MHMLWGIKDLHLNPNTNKAEKTKQNKPNSQQTAPPRTKNETLTTLLKAPHDIPRRFRTFCDTKRHRKSPFHNQNNKQGSKYKQPER